MPRLRRIAAALAGSASDGEDLLQDTVLMALQRHHQWHGENIGGWLYTIMLHLNANARRHRDTLPLLALDGIEDWGEPQPDALMRARLINALEALAPDFREVVLLHDVEGYGYEDIAEKLSIPLGTVMSRLHRAKRHLAEGLVGEASERGNA
ncbi:RNA polymerase sigma factor [Martelella endophytica]|nr:RNA polymerase sigma factor [Martelella endophytica]